MRVRVKALAVLIGLAGLASGCAQEVGDIDRTQPNRVHKSLLDGEWYLARTVIDAPYGTEFTFIGESAELERVRWEIQKDLLIAYRVYDRVEGTDREVSYSEAEYMGSPIVAYPITSHFDIVREYNAATGEQSNVIVENTTDRPWYNRDFIRVDWSKNVLPSLTFLVNWYGFSDGSYALANPVSYHVEDPDHPHHMVVGVRGADGSWTDHKSDHEIASLRSADYLETTSRVFVEPPHMDIYDWWTDTLFKDPACWYYLNQDCEHQNLLVRASFMKVDPDNKYEPVHFPDNEVARDANGVPIRVSRDSAGNVKQDPNGQVLRYDWFDKFGFFRVERYGYDPVYGELESNRLFMAAKFSLFDNDGKPTPIVYYLSADFPEWLKPAAEEIAAAYDAVFTEAVQALGHTPPAHMFEIRENDGQRIGDMRYSFLYYVPKPTVAGLLGYGPSNADPLTGQILSASAYIYGAPLKQYAGNANQIVQVLNGNLAPEELGLGEDVQRIVAQMQAGAGADPAGKPGATPHPGVPLTSEIDHPVTQEQLEGFVEEYVNNPRATALRAKGLAHLKRPSGWYQGQLEKIRGTSFEHLLINDEVKLLRGRSVLQPGDPVPDALMGVVSPVSWISRASREARRRHMQRLAGRNMYMAEFVDDAIAGLALSLKDQGLSMEQMQQHIEIAVAKSTSEHEIGHTLGLRHNFAGSYDALNFPREFWDQHGGAPSFPPTARTPAQIKGQMDEYRYSSIMEYPARFNADIQGLGAYDRAALLFGYAGMVEVFEQAPVDPLAHVFSDTLDLRFALQESRHYSSLPQALGGLDAMYSRKMIPYTELQAQLRGETEWKYWEVPYRYCSDEYEGATMWCAMYDAGMDPYEIVADAADRYRNYYFFRAFKRDVAGWDGWGYESTLYFRYFRHMLNQYQHWAFLSYDSTEQWNFYREDAQFYGIEDVQWDLARDGGAPLMAATRASLRFLIEVLAIPQPGAYLYDPDTDRYWRWDSDPSYWATCGPEAQEKDDPSLNCVDLNVPLGVGRHSFTNYDVDSGYYFYERPKWVGAFADKVLALETLADPEITFLGVNTAEDVQGYALGYFLYFRDILTKVSGGIIADDVNVFAGSTQFGVYYPPDPFQPLPAGRTIVDPDTWSTVQYYAIWLAMSGYAAGFDNTFNDLIHVWWEGSGSGAQAIADPNDPNVASWYDPSTQRTYRAIKHDDDKLYSVGYQLIMRAAGLQETIDNAVAGQDVEYSKILLGYQRELIDLSIGMWEYYGKLLF